MFHPLTLLIICRYKYIRDEILFSIIKLNPACINQFYLYICSGSIGSLKMKRSKTNPQGPCELLLQVPIVTLYFS